MIENKCFFDGFPMVHDQSLLSVLAVITDVMALVFIAVICISSCMTLLAAVWRNHVAIVKLLGRLRGFGIATTWGPDLLGGDLSTSTL